MTLDHLYIRFFDDEVLVSSPQEAIEFLKSMPDIDVTPEMEQDLYMYYDSKMPYPKRYKVRQRCYFIVIKTNARTIEEFKSNANQKIENPAPVKEKPVTFDAFNPGWYDATISFKRVVSHPITNKCQYYDTDFRVRMKAESVQDCYDRLLDHLRNRHDVDPRSQFPSIKGKNFSARFLGMN